MSEYRGHDHFFHVYTEGEEGEERTIEVFHPEACEQKKDLYYDAGYTCDIAAHIREWGYDLYLKDLPEGLYIGQFWATPPGWAGPVAVDADAGIELNRLTIDEGWL